MKMSDKYALIGILVPLFLTACLPAVAEETTVAETGDNQMLVFTVLDDLGTVDGEIVTRQSCVTIGSGDGLITVLPQTGDEVNYVPIFTGTTKLQLLGVIRQFRHLINAETNYRKTSDNVANLQARKDEINIELDEIERIVKIFKPG